GARPHARCRRAGRDRRSVRHGAARRRRAHRNRDSRSDRAARARVRLVRDHARGPATACRLCRKVRHASCAAGAPPGAGHVMDDARAAGRLGLRYDRRHGPRGRATLLGDARHARAARADGGAHSDRCPARAVRWPYGPGGPVLALSRAGRADASCAGGLCARRAERAMKLPFPLLWFALFAMWLLLNDTMEAGQVMLAAGAALVAVLGLALLEPVATRVRRPRAVVRLAAVVLLDIARSNIAVAAIVLGRGRRDRVAGFVDIPLDLRHPPASRRSPASSP